MEKTLDIKRRCTNALTGFVLMDLWQLVSTALCTKRGLKKGSLWLAPQTSQNCQHIALAAISVCCSKNTEGNPWEFGHARLTELGVEESFGRLRVQFASAQMSVRGFFQASAKDALNMKASGEGAGPPKNSMKPLTSKEFQQACEDAYNAALALVAFCVDDMTVESLRKAYEETCRGNHFQQECMAEPDELDDENDGATLDPTSGPEEDKVLENLVEDIEMQEPDFGQEKHDLPDCAHLPDCEDIKKIVSKSPSPSDLSDRQGPEVAAKGAKSHQQPHTLAEVINNIRPGSDITQELFDGMWRLVLFLRHGILDKV